MITFDALNLGFALAGFMCCSLLTISLTLLWMALRATIRQPYAPEAPVTLGTPEYHVVQSEKDHWLDVYRAFAASGWTMIDKSDSSILKGYYDLTFRSGRRR